MARLRQEEPAIEVEIVASNQVENLLRRDADIAVRMVAPAQQDLIARKIADLPLDRLCGEILSRPPRPARKARGAVAARRDRLRPRQRHHPGLRRAWASPSTAMRSVFAPTIRSSAGRRSAPAMASALPSAARRTRSADRDDPARARAADAADVACHASRRPHQRAGAPRRRFPVCGAEALRRRLKGRAGAKSAARASRAIRNTTTSSADSATKIGPKPVRSATKPIAEGASRMPE